MRGSGGLLRRALPAAAVLIALLGAAPASATFPGENGKISFGSGNGIRTVNPDGSGETILAPASAPRGSAKWSPDGSRFATSVECTDGTCGYRLATYAADGTDEQVVPGVEGLMPAWSNDAGHLAYVDVHQTELRAANLDGTNDRLLATPACDPVSVPDWSPDGHRIAYERRPCDPHETGARVDFFCFESEPQCGPLFGAGITTVEDDQVSWSPDGTRVAVTRAAFDGPDVFAFQYPAGPDQRLTTDPATDRSAAWSPDGTKIAFVSNRDDPSPEACSPGSCRHAVYVMDADGANQTRVSSIKDFRIAGLDWQPVPSAVAAGYVRPRSASPARFSLVPAMRECTAPNRVHGPPLAYGSCSPPGYSSSVFIGAGGVSAPVRSVGSLRVAAQVGAPGPPHDSDVKLAFGITNVMEDFVGGEVIDYTGELRVLLGVRLTDRKPGLISSTTQMELAYTVQCTSTASTTVGSDCVSNTTVNALWPGAVTDGRRAVWALEQVRVLDGGSDGDVDTQSPTDLNDPFATQGIFIP